MAILETTNLINRLLDTVKEKHQLVNESALAKHLGRPQIYISRWRNGVYGEAALDTLAPLDKVSGFRFQVTGFR